MRENRIATLLAALIIVTLAGKSHCQSNGGEQTQQITCTGTVVDAQDRPIAGTEVTFYIMEYGAGSDPYPVTQSGVSTTKADGGFSFNTSADSESYRYGSIVANKKGMAFGFGNWDMREGNKELEIKLGQPKELAGIVVDENDRPVSDAEVSITFLIIGTMADQRGLTGPMAMDMFTSTTDNTGRFRFTRIPADATAEFHLKKEGRATVSTFRSTGYSSQKLKYAPSQSDIKLTLPTEARIEGTVVEASSGKPVAGVEVTIRSSQEVGFFRQKPVATDDNGKFSIGALISEMYTLELVQSSEGLADWVAQSLEVTTETGTTSSDIKLELYKGGLLEVVITEAISKKPVEKASARLRQQTNNKYFGAASDKNGIARIRLMPGEYQFDGIYKEGYTRQREEEIVTIEDGKTTRIERQLTGQPSIAGIVRDEKGNPVQGVELKICPMGTSRDISSDAKGKFEVSWDPGRWSSSTTPATVLLGRYEQGNLAGTVEVDEDMRTQDLVLRPALTITGRVVDPEGKGIANARMTAMLRGPRWGSSIGRNQPTADKDGRFEIRALPTENSYSLTARAEGYGENRTEEINANDAVDNKLDMGDVTLAVADLSVSGVVADNDDKPVAGANVSCYGDNQPHQSTRTATDGKFTLDGVCAGKVRISVNKYATTRMYGSVVTEGGASDVKIVISERSSSSTRYVPKRPPSLVRKPLPELKDLNIDLSPASTAGKMILVCFLDIEQRPSRNTLRQLSAKAQQLGAKGVVVAAVQASKIDGSSLDEWRKRYNISFPLGMVQGDQEKARFTWGVRSLPWLILTDSRHVVAAAGFRLSELDAIIEQIEGN